jgi:DNA-binding response OmpR family regulator
LSPQRILVADDDPDVREFLGLVLRPHFELIVARDGLEAWRLFLAEKPRLVLTDLNMPGLNGMQLTEKIRECEERADTPVIILTGTTKDSDLPAGFWKMGTRANQYIEKPVQPDELVLEIRRQIVLHAQTKAKPLPPGAGHY